MEQRTIHPPQCPHVFCAFHCVCRKNSYLKTLTQVRLLWALAILVVYVVVGAVCRGVSSAIFHAEAGWLCVITVVPMAQNMPITESFFEWSLV